MKGVVMKKIGQGGEEKKEVEEKKKGRCMRKLKS